MNNFKERIFSVQNESDFESAALDVFRYQFGSNRIYRDFAIQLKKSPENVSKITDIPFIPVEIFRSNIVLSGSFPVDIIFESSGTTAAIQGRHFVKDLQLYEESFTRTFRMFYGDPEKFVIAALLPSYVERRGSSLVYMADRLIRKGGKPGGFYIGSMEDFFSAIKRADIGGRQVMILGVSFALLDLAEKQPRDLSGTIVMETGGMKGRRKELTRTELHEILKERLNISDVHSEYGMTELMSQAYSKGNGIFYAPPWMKIILRDPQDPLTYYSEPERTGGINIIDLANLNSCAFISTGDLGKLHDDGGFEVLGRFDNSDIRGCNLMVI